MQNNFEIIICTFGNFNFLIKRLIDSILQNSQNKNSIHIGLNNGSIETKNYLRNLLDGNVINTLIDSQINIFKDRMMRKLIDCVDKDYFIWFDDDSYIVNRGWDFQLNEYIENNSDLDIAGFAHTSSRFEENHEGFKYYDFLFERPWYKGVINREQEDKTVLFPIGSTWVGRTDFFRKNNYPDRGFFDRSHQNHDDMMMGDLIKETSGNFKLLFGWEETFKVNKYERRF